MSGTGRVGLIRQRLSEALAPDYLEIVDESEQHRGHPGAARGGGHYRVIIVSPHFEGQSLLARHRLVYAALGDAMRQEIHALSIQARAASEDSG
jgi:BolA protein